MAKKKFYVVWKGREKGIFDTWEECSKQIEGFKGAQYKSFPSRELAEEAFQRHSKEFLGRDVAVQELSQEQKQLLGDPITNSVAVDAAWNTVTLQMEYQGVDTSTGDKLFKMGPFEDATNNIGEFLAIVHALALLKKNGDNRPIYTDSKVAMSWIRDIRLGSELERTDKNQNLFILVDRALKWLEENEYSNKLLKWETKAWGEIPADFGRKKKKK